MPDYRILTVFGPDEERLATLWAKGLQRFWPDHPPVLLLSDGRTGSMMLREVAKHCDAEYVPDCRCREILTRALPGDINELAQANFWVRNLYLPSLACESDILIWDDVDGLFLRTPETWIRALQEYPNACTSIWQQHYGIPDAVDIWKVVKPDIAESYSQQAPAHGTHSAPAKMVLDNLPLLYEFHREWVKRGVTGPGGGAVCEMGAWQGIASAHKPGAALNIRLYQVDYLKLQMRPEMYHSCTEKKAEWFWTAFLDGYERHLNNPVDGFAGCSWL